MGREMGEMGGRWRTINMVKIFSPILGAVWLLRGLTTW